VNLYAESSAVLAWLLGEPAGKPVGEVLRSAQQVAASELVILECERALVRGITLREIDEATAADLRARLHQAAAHWQVWRVSPDIMERARHPFPAEPVRTLDALHLASALAVRSAIPGMELLSLDDRIRRAGKQLGFRLLPA
jgi:predicted nucleic acid-binding protein